MAARSRAPCASIAIKFESLFNSLINKMKHKRDSKISPPIFYKINSLYKCAINPRQSLNTLISGFKTKTKDRNNVVSLFTYV